MRRGRGAETTGMREGGERPDSWVTFQRLRMLRQVQAVELAFPCLTTDQQNLMSLLLISYCRRRRQQNKGKICCLPIYVGQAKYHVSRDWLDIVLGGSVIILSVVSKGSHLQTLAPTRLPFAQPVKSVKMRVGCTQVRQASSQEMFTI